MKDLTKGKPSTLILAFALPIFFANLLQLTYSLVDTRIVGTFLGEDALAAVGATTTLSNLIIGFLQGLSGGFANLYYVMYACVSGNMHMLLEQTITLFATCVAIAFGFNFVDIASRTIMRSMKVEYHIGKSDR